MVDASWRSTPFAAAQLGRQTWLGREPECGGLDALCHRVGGRDPMVHRITMDVFRKADNTRHSAKNTGSCDTREWRLTRFSVVNGANGGVYSKRKMPLKPGIYKKQERGPPSKSEGGHPVLAARALVLAARALEEKEGLPPGRRRYEKRRKQKQPSA